MKVEEKIVGNDGAVEKAIFWRDHLARWEKSGLSQNEYCRQNRLSAVQLRYWKKKFHRSKKESPLTFVPVPTEIPPSLERENHLSGLTILLEKGIRIRLEKNFCGETLEKVIAIFGGGK